MSPIRVYVHPFLATHPVCMVCTAIIVTATRVLFCTPSTPVGPPRGQRSKLLFPVTLFIMSTWQYSSGDHMPIFMAPLHGCLLLMVRQVGAQCSFFSPQGARARERSVNCIYGSVTGIVVEEGVDVASSQGIHACLTSAAGMQRIRCKPCHD